MKKLLFALLMLVAMTAGAQSVIRQVDNCYVAIYQEGDMYVLQVSLIPEDGAFRYLLHLNYGGKKPSVVYDTGTIEEIRGWDEIIDIDGLQSVSISIPDQNGLYPKKALVLFRRSDLRTFK